VTREEAIAHTLEMMERARGLAADAVTRREALGEPDPSHTPPGYAVNVLDDRMEDIRSGKIDQRNELLGLSRGAGDHVWLPEEKPLFDLFYEIEDYWNDHVWEPPPGTRRLTIDDIPHTGW
jgi:hypothetical protein